MSTQSDTDTLVVAAKEENINEFFLGQKQWPGVRIDVKMLPKIKYMAVYQSAPISAITHVAAVASIRPFQRTSRYVLYLETPKCLARPLKRVGGGKVWAIEAPRYTLLAKLLNATNLDEAF